MSRHRAGGGGRGPGRRATPAPTRHRLALLVALAVALVVGVGGAGTYAFWNDRADVTSGSLGSGSMDLRVDENAATNGLNQGYTKTSLTFENWTPGEFVASPLTLRNVGNPPGTYTLEVLRGTSWTYGDDAVVVQAFTGSVVPDTTYPVQQGCSGTALGPAQLMSAPGPFTLVTTPRALAAGAAETICVRVGLATAAGNANQSKTGTVVLRATLTQVT